MAEVVLDQELPTTSIVARNFAEDSSNKIHSDEVAASYGYKGGLVPGVGVYGYMTIPVAEALGSEWLAHGTMTGKFIHPVYHGETVTVTARVVSVDPIRITVSVLNDAGQLCAVGEASLPPKHAGIDISQYPYRPLPEAGKKLSISLDELAADTPLGSLDVSQEYCNEQGESGNFLDELGDPLDIYKGEDGFPHPALITQKANRLLIENVNLGPWIHTASDVKYYDLPESDEPLFLHGHVAHSYTKRGHDIVVLDLAMLGDKERPIAHLTHTAIVRPHKIEETA